ncbi:MAG: chorismate-binding protein [Verrucomicrobiota bacterium]
MRFPGTAKYGIYCDSFFLDGKTPWTVSDDAEVLPLACSESDQLVVNWEEVSEEPWKSEFYRLKGLIEDGHLNKAVPVICETGKVLKGDPAQMLMNRTSSGCGRFFLHASQETGMVGVTPERLFSIEGNQLKTAALAGTARREDAARLLTSPKEMNEHRFVTEFIVQALERYGAVDCGSTGILEVGGLAHLSTPITLAFRDRYDWRSGINELISALHPTPAVGVSPRTEETMAELRTMRNALGVPAGFGAPVGYLMEDKCEIFVAIRCLFWRGDRVFLPAGAGIVRESTAERELAELRLKRDAVKQILGLR